jgi:hypothetical protein
MPEAAITTIGELLEDSIEEADDPELRFKLRTSLQLLDVVRDRHDRTVETVTDVDPEDRIQSGL